ncbi:MAG: hypothetical protein M1821_003605 [Bathelium mastoideum]|nr:MAG: hypothetical protein M1821_003605 [Bathelium mastoideum]KAI9684893.1 MAG: hypothetical protein M1822_005542 [Bathelium mastoideum]
MPAPPDDYVPSYHRTDAPYILPNDATETTRLNFQAEGLKRLLGGKVVQSDLALPQHARILDIGCGTGAVTTDIARAYPSAKVFGVDISLQTASSEKPPNVEYIEGNIFQLVEHDERFKPGSFDFVFHRLLICGITNWQRYMNAVAPLLKPGAFCEFHDYEWQHYSECDEPIWSDWKMMKAYKAVAKQKGYDLHIGSTIADYARASGLTIIKQRMYKVPLSRWMATTHPESVAMGDYHEATEKTFFRHVMTRMFDGTEYTEDDVKQFLQDCQQWKETQNTGRYLPFVVTTGRKPN